MFYTICGSCQGKGHIRGTVCSRCGGTGKVQVPLKPAPPKPKRKGGKVRVTTGVFFTETTSPRIIRILAEGK